MNTFFTIIPIFLLIGLGFILRANNIVKANWVKILNNFVYYVSLPAVIIYSFATLKWSEPGVGTLLWVNLAALAFSTLIITLLLHFSRLDKKTQAVMFLVATVGNTVYLGVPLVQSVLPGIADSNTDAVITAVGVIQLVAALIVAFIMIEYYFLKSKNARFIIQKLIANPLILAIIVGAFLALTGWPKWLDSSIGISLRLLSATASPVALFALGAFLYGHDLKKHLGRLGFISALKLIILPFIFALFTLYLGVTGEGRAVTILMAGMPVAVTAFVLAETYKLDKSFTAAAMLATTLASMVVIPILVFLARQ
ncbi:AEC family transporter [Candidatus Saccharibacteria bacterium]|nr:AEC family transporter [Candidatus Saccharibacteria bacterium]